MNALPAGWVITTIGAVVTLNPKNDRPDTDAAGFVPMNLLGVRYLSPFEFEKRKWGQVKKGYTHFSNGDVLLAKITPCFENGKAGLAADLPNGVGAGSTEYFVCRPKPEALSAKYLLAYFKTLQFRRAGELQMTGSVGHKRVPKDFLLGSELPLAPLAEQQRIVDKLDTLLARVDACRTQLDQVSELLRRFRRSILDAAMSGRLTKDWRTTNRVKAPWLATTVQAVAEVGTGSTPLRSNPKFFAKSGTPWVTSAATSSEIVLASEEHVTVAAIATHRLKIFPVGTLLLAMYGEGKTRGQVTELGIRATINQACAAIVVDEAKAVRPFVKLALQSNYLQMRDLAEGGNQPNLNLSKVKNFPLHLPSLEEQREIVRRISIIFSLADRLDARLVSARKQIARLTPALLSKAFSGELVSPDPCDALSQHLIPSAKSNQPIAPRAGITSRRRGRQLVARRAAIPSL